MFWHAGKKPLSMVSVAIILSLVMLAAFASPVSAGIEPSPFKPQINQLGAVTHQLEQLGGLVDKTLTWGVGPSPFKPVVNKIDAASNKLDELDRKLSSVLEDLPPFNQGFDYLNTALMEVRDAAAGLMAVTGSFELPEGELMTAVGEFDARAVMIVDQVNDYLVLNNLS